MHIVHIVQCTLYSVHCTVYIVQCTLYSVHCTVYIVQCTLYSVHCTVYIVQCTLYSVHFSCCDARYTIVTMQGSIISMTITLSMSGVMEHKGENICIRNTKRTFSHSSESPTSPLGKWRLFSAIASETVRFI